jgi:pimeloyl-ACP methyl ester carboxylesterase
LRRFELFLLFATVAAILWPVVFGVRPRRGIMAGLLTVTLIVQWQIEGYRWQMLPLYLVAVGMAVGDIVFLDRKVEWSHRISRGLFGLAGVIAVSALPIALPVPELPVPSGPQTIGTISLELIDLDRDEIYGETPGGPRRLMAQVWYPARPAQGIEPDPWSADWDVVAPATALKNGFPSWFLNHTRYTRSNAFPSLPTAEGTFPVVVYSHGWTGFRTIGVNQVETLVYNGYMVIVIDNTYGTVDTRFPDAYADASVILVETYAEDIVTVFDALEEGAGGPFGGFAEKADLTRIGVFGHSTGGGAAVRVCLEDPRCDAVLGLDAWVEPLPESVIRVTATKPALFMRSDEWRGTNNDALLRGIAERSEATTYWLGVDGADHNDFVAAPLFSPFSARLGLKGPIPAGRVVPIVDNYLLGFFDVFLLGTGSAALDSVSFGEVALEVINP